MGFDAQGLQPTSGELQPTLMEVGWSCQSDPGSQALLEGFSLVSGTLGVSNYLYHFEVCLRCLMLQLF